MEAKSCGLTATCCCWCYNVLELDIELTVLMSVGYLTVAAHIHPTRVGIGRNIAKTLYTVACRNHTRDATVDRKHAQSTIRRDVYLIVFLAIEWELEAYLYRTRLPVVAVEL